MENTPVGILKDFIQKGDLTKENVILEHKFLFKPIKESRDVELLNNTGRLAVDDITRFRLMRMFRFAESLISFDDYKFKTFEEKTDFLEALNTQQFDIMWDEFQKVTAFFRETVSGAPKTDTKTS